VRAAAAGAYTLDPAHTSIGFEIQHMGLSKVQGRFRYSGPVQDPFGGTRVGMVADPITISRKDYGITWDHKMPDGSPQLADAMTVRLSAEATKEK